MGSNEANQTGDIMWNIHMLANGQGRLLKNATAGHEKSPYFSFWKKKKYHHFTNKICQQVMAISFGIDTDVQKKKEKLSGKN